MGEVIGTLLVVFLFVYVWCIIYTILMLINAAQRELWTWFVVMILSLLMGFGIVTTLLYRFIAFEPHRVLPQRGRPTSTA